MLGGCRRIGPPGAMVKSGGIAVLHLVAAAVRARRSEADDRGKRSRGVALPTAGRGKIRRRISGHRRATRVLRSARTGILIAPRGEGLSSARSDEDAHQHVSNDADRTHIRSRLRLPCLAMATSPPGVIGSIHRRGREDHRSHFADHRHLFGRFLQEHGPGALLPRPREKPGPHDLARVIEVAKVEKVRLVHAVDERSGRRHELEKFRQVR
jgi:hypothetical protein